jgi:hypothetical protein
MPQSYVRLARLAKSNKSVRVGDKPTILTISNFLLNYMNTYLINIFHVQMISAPIGGVFASAKGVPIL